MKRSLSEDQTDNELSMYTPKDQFIYIYDLISILKRLQDSGIREIINFLNEFDILNLKVFKERQKIVDLAFDPQKASAL